MMAVVAPRGEEDASRFMAHGGADGFGLIDQRVVEAAREALPRARARRDEIGAAEFAEASALFLKGMAGVITPDYWYGVDGRILREREVFQEDVAPELHGAAAVATEGA